MFITKMHSVSILDVYKRQDLEFINIFNLFLLIEDESNYEIWQEEALENQKTISRYGQNKVTLKKDGKPIDKEEWGIDVYKRQYTFLPVSTE